MFNSTVTRTTDDRPLFRFSRMDLVWPWQVWDLQYLSKRNPRSYSDHCNQFIQLCIFTCCSNETFFFSVQNHRPHLLTWLCLWATCTSSSSHLLLLLPRYELLHFRSWGFLLLLFGETVRCGRRGLPPDLGTTSHPSEVPGIKPSWPEGLKVVYVNLICRLASPNSLSILIKAYMIIKQFQL